jgi:hypothetical protein
MPIEVSAYPSIERKRNVSLSGAFARTRLSPYRAPGPPPVTIPAIAHSYIDAEVSRTKGGRDCVWRVREVRIRVMMEIEFDTARIARGFFDPNESDPHGYTADAPRDPSHWRLDEENVAVHEESHAQDIVEAVAAAVRQALNRPGVEEQLTITWRCDDEQGAYERLHALVRQRVQAIGTQAFETLLANYQRHQANSATERKARQAQIAEHANR